MRHYDIPVESVDHIISDQERKLFEMINFVVICGVVAVFGISTNIINIIIFYKQGFDNTVNIGFFGLAVSDLCSLIILLWVSICVNPLLASSEVSWIQPEVMYISGAWPQICFCRITSFITVYITMERYLCILLPLKVKQIITPRKTTIIIFLIYFVNIVTLIPEHATTYLDWKHFPEKNRSFLTLRFTNSRGSVEGAVFVLHSLLTFVSFAGVIIGTTALVIKLRQSSEWRKSATSGYERAGLISNRDKKTVKMVVLIATILIACYIPGAIISLITFTVGPEFNIKGKYTNICEATWSVAFPFQALNSSINIFLYYRMSSKYRNLFKNIFCDLGLSINYVNHK